MDPTLTAFCVLMALLGCAIGTFSGMIPGIHVNTLAALLLASYPAIEAIIPLEPSDSAVAVACCVMSASIVHSYVDFVPSVFIGAPDSEDAVSVLPGHRLLLQGRGMEAVRSAAIGSLVGCSASIAMALPLQWLLLNGTEGFLDGLTPLVLLIASAVLLSDEWRRGTGIWGVLLFLLSGALGLGCMVLPIQMNGILGEGSVMMPLLTGLFGIPVMLEASDGAAIPKQYDRIRDPTGHLPGLKGVAMGTLAGWFPGITATVGASMSAVMFPERRPTHFISIVASIGTVTSVLSLVTLSVSGNGRSGTALVIGEMTEGSLSGFMSPTFLLLLLSSAVASLLGYWITISCGRLMARIVGGIRPRRLSRTVLILLVTLTLMLNGPLGMFVLLCSTMVGVLPGLFGTGRVILCGCLILPVLLFEFGLFRSIQLRCGLGHELGIVHHEPLVRAGADLPHGIVHGDLEHQPPAVDLHQLDLAGDLHAYGGRCRVGDVQMRADRAVPVVELWCDALARGRLDQRDHGGCREHRERSAAQGLCGIAVVDHDLARSFDSDAKHGLNMSIHG